MNKRQLNRVENHLTRFMAAEMVPIFCFFYLLVLVTSSTAMKEMNPECQELRCSHHGPPIRFPFKLKGMHPDHCGYSTGFDLSCNTKRETLLELPVSMEPLVSKIDYKKQLLHLHDPTRSLMKRLPFLNLSASPFGFTISRY